MCHEAEDERWTRYLTLDIDEDVCDLCPLWNIFKQPLELKGSSNQCVNYLHKGKRLTELDSKLHGNKGALRALAVKILK